MRVLITGAKSAKDLELVSTAVADSRFEVSHVYTCGKRGVDGAALDWAAENSIDATEVAADWSDVKAVGAVVKKGRNGRYYNAAAGKMRALRLAEACDAAIVIAENKSDSREIRDAFKHQGKPVHYFVFDETKVRTQLNERARAQMVEWAAGLKSIDSAVVLDTESTGGSANDEVISIAVVRVKDGAVLFDETVNPSDDIRFNYYASKVHGLDREALKGSPRFSEIWESLKETLRGNEVLAYNYSSDKRMLEQTANRHGFEFPEMRWHCIMKSYKQYSGKQTNVSLSTACLELKVKSGDHTAAEDALAAARVVHRMASNYEPKPIEDE